MNREELQPMVFMDRRLGIAIYAQANQLVARFHFERREPLTKTFDHIDDLFTLSLNGVLQLAKEFYDQIISTEIQTGR